MLTVAKQSDTVTAVHGCEKQITYLVLEQKCQILAVVIHHLIFFANFRPFSIGRLCPGTVSVIVLFTSVQLFDRL